MHASEAQYSMINRNTTTLSSIPPFSFCLSPSTIHPLAVSHSLIAALTNSHTHSLSLSPIHPQSQSQSLHHSAHQISLIAHLQSQRDPRRLQVLHIRAINHRRECITVVVIVTVTGALRPEDQLFMRPQQQSRVPPLPAVPAPCRPQQALLLLLAPSRCLCSSYSRAPATGLYMAKQSSVHFRVAPRAAPTRCCVLPVPSCQGDRTVAVRQRQLGHECCQGALRARQRWW